MLSRLYYPLLLTVAILSGFGFFWAIVNDAYADAWCVALVMLGISALVGAILWGFVALVRRTFARSHPRHEPSNKIRTLKSTTEKYGPPLFLVGTVLFIFCYFMGVSVIDLRESYSSLWCRNNLKTIGLALHNYHQKYDSLPPAYTADENGKPMHSWRVLLLPYLEDGESKLLFEQYDFNEPWDSQNNRKLIDQIPRDYVCPEDNNHSSSVPGRTSYVAILGTDAAWRGDKPMKLDDFQGGSSKTALLVEVADSDIAWTEPRDLSLDEIRDKLNLQSGTRISAKHRIPQTYFSNLTPGGIHILRADGSATFLPADQLTPESLEKTLRVGGCPEGYYGNSGSPSVNWWNCSVLLIFVCSVYLLLHRAARNGNVANERIADSDD